MLSKVTQPNRVTHTAEHWVDEYGDSLFRIAYARISDRSTAEDLVQETFLAAWKARSQFDGRATLLTWLVAILKRKIADHFRAHGRQPHQAQEFESYDELFDSQGIWNAKVEKLPKQPENSVETEEFWQVITECVSDLPGPLAQSFHLRELESKPTAEACQELGITKKNLSVRLHRARLLLRRCLESKWLG